ncbi:hypothetical protein MBLNU230_g6483t1 [Neophaeotheca triangularis]
MTSLNDSFDNTYLYNQLDSYDWENDPEFQGGLGAIIGPLQDQAQVEHLTLRAKCYYYARRTGTPVDFDGYKQWVEIGRGERSTNGTHTNNAFPAAAPASSEAAAGAQESNVGVAGGMADAPKPASFADICDMIAEGKPIPGIKDIPDTILEGQASEPQKQKRRKPWEKEEGQEGGEGPKLSWM